MTERGEHPVFGSREDERSIDAKVLAANAEAETEPSVIPEPQDRGEVTDHFPIPFNETGAIGPRAENVIASKPAPPETDIDTLLAKLDPFDIQNQIGEITEENADVPR